MSNGNSTENKTEIGGLSVGAKWAITIALALIAIFTVIMCAMSGNFTFKPGSVQANDDAIEQTVAPETEEETDKTETHNVFVSAGYGGTVDPKGSTKVEEWGSLTITVTPNEGYQVKSVTVDGENKGALTSYTLSYIGEDHTIVVSFEKEPEPTPTPTTYDDWFDEFFGDE